MGAVRPVQPVKLICGMIAAGEEALAAAQAELKTAFGRIDLESRVAPFAFTDYYRVEMGEGLLRKFVAFEGLTDPAKLTEAKLRTNAIEENLASRSAGGPKRRVNLDPGYVTAAKLVLATTKDFSHRIYLSRGIFAEVTLNFRKDGCAHLPWTYPDFRSGAYDEFLLEARRRAIASRTTE